MSIASLSSVSEHRGTKMLDTSIILLRIVGVWPEKGILRFLPSNVFAIGLSCIFYWGVIADLIEQIINPRGDLETLVNSFTTTVMGLTLIVSLIIFYSKRESFVKIYNELPFLDGYFECPDIDEVRDRIRKTNKYYITYLIFSGLPFVLMPSFQKEVCRKLRSRELQKTYWPCGIFIPLKYPFAYHESPGYEAISLIAIFHVFTYIFVVSGLQSFIFSICEHIIRHLRNLRKVLVRAINEADKGGNFRRCIDYHIAITRFFADLDSCSSFFIFVYTSTITLIIGGLKFEIISALRNYEGLVKYFPAIVAWTGLLFVTSYLGQRLQNECATLLEEFYCSRWEDCPLSMQMDVVFILQRMQSPLCLTVGPLGPFGVQTFYNIMSSAYSIFAIIVNKKSGNEK